MSTEPNNNQPSALPSGTMLKGSYQIVSVLGLGGFGVTYLAWDSVREAHVVIKECLPGDYAHRVEGSTQVQANSGETGAMFLDCLVNARQEAETLSQFSNEGVVQVYDLFDENGTFYYTMEYLQGQTLYSMMMSMRERGEVMSPEQAESLLVFILEILEHLHQYRIYHCDIKPGNIFIMPDGKPKLIDFGAVRSKELQHQGLVQITPGYTPAEFYPGSRRELGPWSDIYELGATFYELLTGEVPEPANQRFKVDRMVKISSIETLRNMYPLVFLSSIDKALSPDFHHRFKTARAWIEYIDSYGGGKQLQTVNPHSAVGGRMLAAGAARMQKKKKGAGEGILAVILILLIVGGAAFGIHKGIIDLSGMPQLSFLADALGAPKPEEKAGESKEKTDETADKGVEDGDKAQPAEGGSTDTDGTADTPPAGDDGEQPTETPDEPSPADEDEGDIIIEEE